jgi:hypothetical protein
MKVSSFGKLVPRMPDNAVGSKNDMAATASGAYFPKEKLRAMWDRFVQELDGFEVSPKTFDDALLLLEAQGKIDAGLVFLSPSFMTDLLRPLIDHTLS